MVSKDLQEKRKKRPLSFEEHKIVHRLFFKALLPIVITIIVSCIVLFFGFEFLMGKASFGNYGLNPGGVSHTVSRFIATYAVIAAANIILMILMSFAVIYMILHEVVLPILRITRETREIIDSPNGRKLTVRKSDYLFIPLVELLNKLIDKVS